MLYQLSYFGLFFIFDKYPSPGLFLKELPANNGHTKKPLFFGKAKVREFD